MWRWRVKGIEDESRCYEDELERMYRRSGGVGGGGTSMREGVIGQHDGMMEGETG